MCWPERPFSSIAKLQNTADTIPTLVVCMPLNGMYITGFQRGCDRRRSEPASVYLREYSGYQLATALFLNEARISIAHPIDEHDRITNAKTLLSFVIQIRMESITVLLS